MKKQNLTYDIGALSYLFCVKEEQTITLFKQRLTKGYNSIKSTREQKRRGEMKTGEGRGGDGRVED